MIKTAEQQIQEYLQANPKATREEIISKVFYGYVGNGRAKKALNKLVTNA